MTIFISDYDGTYFKPSPEGEAQLQRNQKAVLNWQNQGHLFGFSTGRILPLMALELNRLDLPIDFMIAANGALVVDNSFQPLVHHHLPTPLVQEVLKTLKTLQLNHVMLSNGWDGYFSLEARLSSSMAPVFHQLQKEGLFQLPLEAALAQGVSQLSILELSTEAIDELTPLLKTLVGEQAIVYPNRSSIDLSPAHVSKATGIQTILEHFQLSSSDAFCMGDNWNDLEMLQTYRGITLPEAPDCLKTVASQVFPTVEVAIEWALSQVNLNK